MFTVGWKLSLSSQPEPLVMASPHGLAFHGMAAGLVREHPKNKFVGCPRDIARPFISSFQIPRTSLLLQSTIPAESLL
jgi:hypothetical protein